jgi:hypothetical protein
MTFPLPHLSTIPACTLIVNPGLERKWFLRTVVLETLLSRTVELPPPPVDSKSLS